MKNEQALDNVPHEDIYHSRNIPFLRIFLFAFLFLFLGLFWGLPVKEIIKSEVDHVIAGNRACPMQYKGLNISFLLPKIALEDLTLSGLCFRKRGNGLLINDLTTTLIRPSFYPIGLRLRTIIQSGKSKIDLNPIVSLSKHLININESTIDSSLINYFIGRDVLAGNINLEGMLTLRRNLISEAEVLLTSENLETTPQKVPFFGNFSAYKIGDLKAHIDMSQDGVMLIKKFDLGNSSSALLANIAGKIEVNKINFRLSKIDLTGKVKFSKKILNEIAAIKILLLSAKPTKDGFYKFRLQGSIAAPKHKFL